MEDLWVVLRLSRDSESRISEIRDRLRPAMPDLFEEETDPHISVLPGFRLPETEVDSFQNFVKCGIEHPDRVRVTGLECYPDDPPKVIMLNCLIDVTVIRKKLQTVITHEAVGGEVKYPAYDPHITLFKGGDGPAEGWKLKEKYAQEIHSAISNLEADASISTTWTDSNISMMAEVRT